MIQVGDLVKNNFTGAVGIAIEMHQKTGSYADGFWVVAINGGTYAIHKSALTKIGKQK
jgi:uncharacterized membrane protein